MHTTTASEETQDHRETLLTVLSELYHHVQDTDLPITNFAIILWHGHTQLAHLMGQPDERPFVAHTINPPDMPMTLWRLGDLLDEEQIAAEQGNERPDIVTGQIGYDDEGRRHVLNVKKIDKD